ncbi:SET domain-containing protein [Amanita rubescens]|nr:SET domain-containing protein [Amanita rubescens]
MRITQFPFHTAVGEPYSIFLLYPGAKEAIEAIPGLPTPYMPSLRVHYRIGDAPGAGKGMFALTDLDTGDLILRERPLLLFPRYTFGDITSLQMIFMRMITSMKLEDCAEFIKLANCKTEGDPIVGIMHTNALNALRMPGPYDGRYGGVCLNLSRVNHSCSPNATCRWILKDIMFELRALRPIKKGEQIFISYIYLLQSRSDRQEHLQSSYAFACTCPSCSLPPSGISHSDIRRNLLENRGTIGDPNDASILNTWIKDISLPDDHVIGHSLKFVDIMNAEGFVDEQVCELHYPRLAKAYCALKDAENAKLWAKRTAQIVMAIYGDDYGWNKVADSPESTDWWGRRKRGLSCS